MAEIKSFSKTYLTFVVLIIFFWLLSNKIPFLNFHIGLGTEFDYAWVNSINFGNSTILKKHFLDFFNSTIITDYEIGKDLSKSAYNIFNPFYFLSYVKLGSFSIFFSTLLTAIICFTSLQRIIYILEFDKLHSYLVSYLLITFWSLKFTQDHFQMLSSFHFLFIYLHFFLEVKNNKEINYRYFIFCFLLAPMVSHLGFVLWIFIPSIIGFIYIKNIKKIFFYIIFNLSWLPWILLSNDKLLNIISNVENKNFLLSSFSIKNFFLHKQFQIFFEEHILSSFFLPIKVVGMVYIPIGLFIYSLISCIILKIYKQKFFNFLISIFLISIFTIYFINTNFVVNFTEKSMNRFLFIFVACIFYIFILLNFFYLNQKKVGKFWYFLFVVFLIVDLYYLNYFYNKKHHYLINFDIRPSLMVIYLFLFVCLLFLSNLKSNKLQIALVILTFLQSLSYYSIQKKNYLGSDFASFKKAETCLNTIYPKNQSIRIIATGESDRNSRTQLRNYNNLFKYLLDYSNGTNKNYLFKYSIISDKNVSNTYSKNFNYKSYNREDRNKFPPSIYSINEDDLHNQFENIGVDFLLYIKPYKDNQANKLFNDFKRIINKNFEIKNKNCKYKNSEIFIFQSKKSFSDAFSISNEKFKYLPQIDYNKWKILGDNKGGDIVIMNQYNKYVRIYNNNNLIPHQEEKGFIKISENDLSQGFIKLEYYSLIYRLNFFFYILSYLILFLISGIFFKNFFNKLKNNE